MDFTLGITFLSMEVLFILLTLLAVVRTGFARLDSAIGIWRDGLSVGKEAPPWRLPDSAGYMQSTPARTHWQFLIFTDHSLMSFPALIVGIHHLMQVVQDLEVLVLSRGDKEYCESIVRGLNLKVPVVPVDQTFYNRYRVRIMPFAILLDPHGITRWVGLVNTEIQLLHTWQIIRATVHEDMLYKKEIR